MQFKWLSCLSFALAAGCNWLAGIDARETAQAAVGGEAGAIVGGGPSGHGGAGGSSNTAHGGLGDAGSGGIDAGAGGAAGDDESGGATSSGGGGGTAKGGSAGTGGRGGAGGATSPVECRPGYTKELDATDWRINTGIPMGGNSGWIDPLPKDDPIGLFQEDGTCVCVTGRRTSYADLYFIPRQGPVNFNTLNIRLISAPNMVIPTIYVHVQGEDPGKKHCLVIFDQQSKVTQGTELQLHSADFVSNSNCNEPNHDLAANSLIDTIFLQFADYGAEERKDFDLCVLSLSVN